LKSKIANALLRRPLMSRNQYVICDYQRFAGSLGVAVIPARSGGIKSDKIQAKMQLGSAEQG
jgi:hypothetical protein